jgi:hypothetical protein
MGDHIFSNDDDLRLLASRNDPDHPDPFRDTVERLHGFRRVSDVSLLEGVAAMPMTTDGGRFFAALAFWGSLFSASVGFLAFCVDSLLSTPEDVVWWLIAAMFAKLAVDSGLELGKMVSQKGSHLEILDGHGRRPR